MQANLTRHGFHYQAQEETGLLNQLLTAILYGRLEVL